VTTEISGAGQHKNVFSTSVPVIDYEKRGYSVTEEEAVEHVKRYGGIFAYNHPFENEKYKALKDLTLEEVRAYVEEESASLIEKKVYGATLMEVGFPCGRGCFGLAQYLSLWDKLSLAGVFITGYGDSDSHYNDRRWFDGNNFASWIAVPKKAEFPVSEEILIKSMRAGDVYMGDPVLLKSEISFTSGNARMGSVVIAEKEPRKMHFTVKGPRANSLVRVIKNGELFIENKIDSEEDYSLEFELSHEGKVSFARVEMYDENGRCIMLTNPIYQVDEDMISEIAEERTHCNYVLREKADAERFSSPYTENIEIPSGVYEIKGKKLLHIGDTHSENYPYFARLIELVKPDIILHTGDLADEVKAGRIPYTRYEYRAKIKHILEALRKSGARVIIVPGNNDIEEVIKELLPEAELYKKNSVVEIDGVEVRVGHQVTQMTYDKAWAFYGHGFTGEKWDYSQNEPGKECRFNACLGAFVCSTSENKFYLIRVPERED
ncbi:MAG: metallophosphoesterase, partial [Clostridia bacterium]|nr:metallophosphoesterase [Clostridia bacterium]